jgi:hypothetical protein
MSNPGADIAQRLDATLQDCIDAAQVGVGAGDAGSTTITLPITEWSRLVQDAARAVGYLTPLGGSET